uniref:Uncharacterized protein n=1 Tax=Rhizophora mucronata TaxID=61149 RepID=A0A2P2QFV4_RHIMU
MFYSCHLYIFYLQINL